MCETSPLGEFESLGPRNVELETKPSVLVVEDDKALQLLYQLNFGERADLTIAKDIDSALSCIGEELFTLIIVDGFNGDWLKVAETAGEKSIQVVVVSATDYAAEAGRMNIRTYLKGEFDFQDLVNFTMQLHASQQQPPAPLP